jgi:integrase
MASVPPTRPTFDLGHSEMLIGPYLEQWLDDQRRHLKATIWASYQVAAARIIRLLGWQSLTDLTPLAIEAFYAKLGRTGSRSGKPLAPKSVRNTHVVLREALADAERLRLVQRNAAAAARPPAAPRREPTTWSAAEIRAFLDSVAEDRLLATYVLLATTGMRRGRFSACVGRTLTSIDNSLR